MFRKTRIRSLVAISALTGATVLGGAGLAGAEAHLDEDSVAEVIEVIEVDETDENLVADSTEVQEVTTDTAAGPEDTDTHTAADPEDTDTDTAADPEDTEVAGAQGNETDGTEANEESRNHGQAVSQRAKECQEDHSGYKNRGHCVRDVARGNAGEQREDDIADEQDAEGTEGTEGTPEEGTEGTEGTPEEGTEGTEGTEGSDDVDDDAA
jgi:hypothetical protein